MTRQTKIIYTTKAIEIEKRNLSWSLAIPSVIHVILFEAMPCIYCVSYYIIVAGDCGFVNRASHS
jgi:hypothetical protein